MKHRIGTLILLMISIVGISGVLPQGQVLGATSYNKQPSEIPDTQKFQVTLATTTAFEQKQIKETETIPFETKYEKDSDLEYGTEKIKQEGKNGIKTNYYLVTFWGDDIIDKEFQKTDTVDPADEIIIKGTKIVWHILEGTEVGRIKYWHKMRVWATKYDANCVGCTGRTYSGTEVRQGVCATDPKVIKLGTNFYVPGYGVCRAEDIGGAIKGNKIDLGYVDASKGAWRTGYTDIYLLTNAPAE